MNNTPLKILIAEDVVPTQELLRQFLIRFGHTILMADNGQQAVALFKEHQPDMILCDVNMPFMNGLEAIKEIRAIESDVWTPILILSASDQDGDIIIGLEAGADDYLPKPMNLKILKAKVEAMQRFVALQKINTTNKAILQNVNSEFEEEQVLAMKIARNMLNQGDLKHDNVEYWLQPNRLFSGDLIAASLSSDDVIFVLLADSTGHGLGAALPTLTVSRTFHTLVEKGVSLKEIIIEMNISSRSLLALGKFIATNVFAIDFKNKTIEAWCGGLPEAFVINDAGEIVHRFKSTNLALGILTPESFDSTTCFWQWDEPVELISFSDGITEAETPEGIQFGEQAIIDILQETPRKARLKTIKKRVLAHLNADFGGDDILLASVYCD